MTDIIESMRGLRNHSLTYERAMSDLTVAIGNVERLTDLTPDQMERLWAATARLGNAASAKDSNRA
jgi:hypothetical protein